MRIGVKSEASNGSFGTIALGIRKHHHPMGTQGRVPVIRKTRAFLNVEEPCYREEPLFGPNGGACVAW